MIGNHVYPQGYRGFESRPLRNSSAWLRLNRDDSGTIPGRFGGPSARPGHPRPVARRGPLAAGVSAAGHVYVDATGIDALSVDDGTAARIREGFAAGSGAGVLHLGAAEIDTVLPPSLAYFRDLGRLFVTQVCALP